MDEDIINSSLIIRNKLKQVADFEENPIDDSLSPIKAFYGSDNISLIILGQDPTIKNISGRSKIEYTLNLDKNGALKKYIGEICKGLGFTIENVYATNIFKYFYKIPPAKTMNVLQKHLPENLNLVRKELSNFPDAIVISLGEPVLQLLAGTDRKVREFWDYNNLTKQTNGNYRFCRKKDNLLNRDFFPFPHQPSIRKVFYREHLSQYINYVKNQA